MGVGRGRPPLVGRDDELGLLDEELAVASQGHFRAVLLMADPGVGKTRLAAELAVRRHDVIRLTARAHPFGATTAFGVWVEVLERHLRSLDRDDVLDLVGDAAADLAALLPSVAAVAPSTTEQPPRIRVLLALGRVLRALSRRGPVVLVIDDVHLADGASWSALHHLAGQLADAPVLVVLTARPVELGQDATATGVVLALEQDGVLARYTLAPLPAASIQRLATTEVGTEAPDQLVDWLMERSRGNPLFALGLLRALVEEGADLSRPTLRRLPEDLSQQIRGRLESLEPRDRALLELVGMLGFRVRVADLLPLTSSSEAELSESLDRLLRSRLLIEDEQGWDLRFEIAHPLVQTAIYEGMGPAQRRAMHRAVARALSASGRLGMAAPHFVRSAEPGDDEAVEALCAALREADHLEQHRESLALLEGLLQLLPEGDTRWLRVLEQMQAQPEWVVDHRADSGAEIGVRAMRRIYHVAQLADNPGRQAAVAFTLGSLLIWGTGDLDEGARRVRTAQELFRQAGNSPAVLLAESELGYAAGICGDLAGHERIARAVIDEARTAGDRLCELQGLCSVTWALQFQGRLTESEPFLAEALQLARDLDKAYRSTYLLAHHGWEAAMAGRMSEAEQWFRDCEASSASFLDTHYSDLAAQAMLVSGDLQGAVATYREAISWCGGLSRRRTWGTTSAILALAELGRFADATQAFDEADALHAGRDWWVHSSLPTWARGTTSSLAGDPRAALPYLSQSVTRLAAVGSWLFACLALPDLAEAALDAEDVPALDEAGQISEGAAGVSDQPVLAALAQLTRGTVAVGRGDLEAAREELTAAAAGFAAVGWPLHGARARVMLGRALAPSDRAAAVAALAAAAEVFSAYGATARLERVQLLLDRLGQSRTRGDGTRLTPRERQVIELAAEGRTARDIARALFIGERTVETHLAHAYAKLGVSSRVELVRVIAGLDLAEVSS